MKDLFGELKVTIRTLLRKPLFTLAVIATLGVGIGANTTVFSIVYGVLFKPLPYAESGRLVGVYRFLPDLMGPSVASISDWYAVPYPLYDDWVERATIFEDLGAYAGVGMTVTGRGEPDRVSGMNVTSGVFETLGIAPLLGQPFSAADDRLGMPPKVLLSHAYWESRLGSDPAVVGEALVINGWPHTIAGVMPRGFAFPSEDERLWATFPDSRRSTTMRAGGFLKVVGRLTPDVSIDQARLDMEQVRLQIAEDYPVEEEFGVRVLPYAATLGATARPALLLLLGAVGTVLLIACANVANLVLARTTERRKELGVRQALGAGRGRLLTHVLSECLLLSLAGGAVGCVIATVGVRPFVSLFPTGLPRASEIGVDGRVLLFALGLSVLVALLIGVLPALRSTGRTLTDALLDVGRAHSGGAQRHRAQALIVVSEIALAFVLLTGAGLFLKSFTRMMSVDPGFAPEQVLAMRLSVTEEQVPSDDGIRTFYVDLLGRLRALPGVRTVGAANQMPFVGGRSFPPTSIETPTEVVEANIHTASVTPEYFQAMTIPVVAGRVFNVDDRPGSPPVAIINQAMASQFWPGESPLGRRVRENSNDEPAWRTVVGVIGDVKYGLRDTGTPAIHVPFQQRPTRWEIVVVKSDIPPRDVIASAREVVHSLEADLPVEFSLLPDRIRDSEAVVAGRFVVAVVGGLAGAAGLLAVLGIYGVLAYTVAQRTQEIGIRMALGAGTGNVVRSVVGRGLLLSAVGLAVGAGGAVAAGRLVESQLFGVSPSDPATLAAVVCLVLVATLAASWIPARRATRIAPIDALRYE
ncbi:MAG: ABC transporter permease [Vicinamibacterales bacterium]|nr:ABC transporter permease [Vicinamibacterales bacterium]